MTLTFENGRWRDHGEGNPEDDCVGPYSVEAGRISLHTDRAECGVPAGTLVMSARWTLEDGKLRFFDVQPGTAAGVGKQTLDEDRLNACFRPAWPTTPPGGHTAACHSNTVRP